MRHMRTAGHTLSDRKRSKEIIADLHKITVTGSQKISESIHQKKKGV
jgi:hypothetical protein